MKNKSFEDFLLWGCNTRYFQTQYSYFYEDGKTIVNFIGKFESLAEDFKHISRELKIDTNLPFENKTGYEAEENPYNQIQGSTLKIFNSYFKKDFICFNYKLNATNG